MHAANNYFHSFSTTATGIQSVQNSMNPFQAKLDVPPNSLPKRQCQSSRLHPSHDA